MVRRYFDREFKDRAVRLVLEQGRPAETVARNLGLNTNILHRWKREYLRDKENRFPGKGHLKPEDAEIKRLKKELADITEERDILKKAMAFFAKHPD